MKRKMKSLWLFLDGKKHCDVIKWALAANVDKDEAKKQLSKMYERFEKIEFKLI